jgi:RNA-binding protein YlmH
MPPSFSEESDLRFVSADTLLARALEQEATAAERAAISNAQIGAEHIEVHKCSYSVAVDGTVSCQGCGKGTVKKVSHRGKRHGKPTKSY